MTKNKPWDVTPERLAFLIKACMSSFTTWIPPTNIEYIESSLAKWHESRDMDKGKGSCGGCRLYSWDCGKCVLNTPDGCCDGIWEFWSDLDDDGNIQGASIAAEAVYQFILGKYWEEIEKCEKNQT